VVDAVLDTEDDAVLDTEVDTVVLPDVVALDDSVDVTVEVTVVDCELDWVLLAVEDCVDVWVVDGDVTSQLSRWYVPSAIPFTKVLRVRANNSQSAVTPSAFCFGMICMLRNWHAISKEFPGNCVSSFTT
jgi:hypothetical protein